MSNIISLVGMMGVGKTSVGKFLADKLGYKFIDLDKYIEKAEDKKVTQIFNENGEAHFRFLEKKYVSEIVKSHDDLVFSLGGGSFISKDIRDILKNVSKVVWLNCASEEIFKRTKNEKHRPLLADDNSLEKIKKILEERTKYYKQAHFHINTDNKSVSEVCNEILKI